MEISIFLSYWKYTSNLSDLCELSREENAQNLLLGCGGPRNILHTVHSDLSCGEYSEYILSHNVDYNTKQEVDSLISLAAI